ncbi:MAG: C4-dicarboxylate transporter DcuC [Treponema sp.]|nr:C4-dicarboxylate transporter DcuC [Treponema sp.]
MINLIITIAFVITCVVLINKGFPTTMIFLFLGVVISFIFTALYGNSVANISSGHLLLDIFEAVKETFVSAFSSIGLSMLPIYGYSIYMGKIKAGAELGKIISLPIAKSKNPYFIGIFIAVMICGIMRIAIVSAVAIMALFLTTLYPALLRAGISRESAISAIFLGTCFDWGPADFVIAQFVSGIPGLSTADYFVNGSLRVAPIVLVLVSITSGVIMQFIDKRSGYVYGSHMPEEAAAEDTGASVPGFYAIFPLLPLIIIIIFSPIFKTNINISVITAVLLSIIVVFVVEVLRTKNIKDRTKDINQWINGMGDGFGNLLVMATMAQFFANMLGKLNGFRFLIDSVLNAGVSGILLLVFFGLLMFIMSVLQGGGGVVGITLAPTLMDVSASLGISFYAAAIPMQLANGLRCLNVGTVLHMQYCMKSASCSAGSIIKRCVAPSVIMYVSAFILSLILL